MRLPALHLLTLLQLRPGENGCRMRLRFLDLRLRSGMLVREGGRILDLNSLPGAKRSGERRDGEFQWNTL